MNYIENITKNILISIYQLLGASVLVAVLFMFVYIFAKNNGWKKVFPAWVNGFKENKDFRSVFWLALYTAMILFKTVLTRKIWGNPLSDIFGGWGIHDNKGVLATESIENVLLFIPFALLALVVFKDKMMGRDGKVHIIESVKMAIKVTFVVSATIEITQLLLKAGTFQFSDMVYNTLGGIIGGVLYFIVNRVKEIRR